MRDLPLIAGLLTLAIMAAAAIWLGKSSDMLRDAEPTDFGGAKPSPNGEYRRPYSLAQSQMTWWFCIVLGSFVCIALGKFFGGHLDNLSNILTEQSLILMGIGTGTALGATIIEQVKQPAAGDPPKTTLDKFKAVLTAIKALQDAGQPIPAEMIKNRDDLAAKLASQNFFNDILTDVDGISLHRFQSMIWTVIIGVAFLVVVFTSGAMPKLDALVLAVLGISAGTYLGFKVPEQPA